MSKNEADRKAHAVFLGEIRITVSRFLEGTWQLRRSGCIEKPEPNLDCRQTTRSMKVKK
jgi:hypothetical protein